jgi:hypothetical protein
MRFLEKGQRPHDRRSLLRLLRTRVQPQLVEFIISPKARSASLRVPPGSGVAGVCQVGPPDRGEVSPTQERGRRVYRRRRSAVRARGAGVPRHDTPVSRTATWGVILFSGNPYQFEWLKKRGSGQCGFDMEASESAIAGYCLVCKSEAVVGSLIIYKVSSRASFWTALHCARNLHPIL